MRLTHKITMQKRDRETLEVEYNPEPDQEHDIVLVLRQDPEDKASTVYLSHEQYDVIADLVWAHRPDTVQDAPAKCGQALATSNTSFLECALNDGHANPRDEDAGPNPAGGYHVTSDGTLFAVPALPF